MLELPLYMQTLAYPAKLDRQLIADIFDVEGVLNPASGALKVSPRAAGANMSVDLAAGPGIIAGDGEAGQGSYRIGSTAVENLPIGAAPGSNSRIDLVIARIRDATVTGGSVSDWVPEVLPGAVAASPVAPPVPASAIPLAQVLVAAGVVSIDAAKITDRRKAAGNAAYAPVMETSRVTLGAGGMQVIQGAPSRGNPNVTWTYWLLDSATTETVGSVVGVPLGWQTVNVDLWWVNAGTGAGQVVVRLVRQNATEGVSIGSFAAVTVTPAAAGQNILTRTRLETGLSVADATRLMSMGVERRGSDAADTLPNDIGVLAVVLTKAS